MEKAGKLISGTLCWLIAAAAGILGFYYAVLPGTLSAETFGTVTGNFCGARVTELSGGGCRYTLCGMEIKPVDLKVKARKMLIPGGEPFGIKLRTDGVMVVSVNTGSPAEKCGIRAGDMITSVNGVEVGTNSEIGEAVQRSSECCTVIVRRGNGEKQIRLTPESVDGCLRLGAWVRDSAAGIGTMTFCDPDAGMFAGLGHPVSDVTTGELMPLSSGEATTAEIYSAIRGRNGETGELCGELCEKVIGSIDQNTQVGVFGTLDGEMSGTPMPMAFRQEVKCGAPAPSVEELKKLGYTHILIATGAWQAGKYDYYDRVSHNGCLWLCVNEKGTDSEPTEGNADWLKQVDKGADGTEGSSPVMLAITSSKGVLFQGGVQETLLTATAYRDNLDITAKIPPSRFSWTRTSTNTEDDALWNSTHRNVGRSITIDADDVNKSAVFSCDVELSGLDL